MVASSRAPAAPAAQTAGRAVRSKKAAERDDAHSQDHHHGCTSCTPTCLAIGNSSGPNSTIAGMPSGTLPRIKHASQNNECNEGHGQERRSSSAARSRANCVGQTRPNSIAETRRAEYEMLPSLFGGILAVPGKRNLAARDKAPKWRGQQFGQCPFWNGSRLRDDGPRVRIQRPSSSRSPAPFPDRKNHKNARLRGGAGRTRTSNQTVNVCGSSPTSSPQWRTTTNLGVSAETTFSIEGGLLPESLAGFRDEVR